MNDIATLLQSLPARVAGSEHLLRIGRHCSTEFLVEVDEAAFHLVVENGRLTAVVPGPLRMRAWRFALRGPADAWQRFWRPEPPVGFNDIFAMARHGHLRIEGDVGPLLEHLRYLKEVLALPREMLAEAGR